MADTNRTREESEVLHALLARRDNYSLHRIVHSVGKYYDVFLGGEHYIGVVLFSSFEYYVKRYHLADIQPTLCISMVHNTVLPCACLSLRASNLAQPYELPAVIENVARDRKSKTGSQVLLGMYLLGMDLAQNIIFAEDFPSSTRKRYLARARQLRKRPKGRPVGSSKLDALNSP